MAIPADSLQWQSGQAELRVDHSFPVGVRPSSLRQGYDQKLRSKRRRCPSARRPSVSSWGAELRRGGAPVKCLGAAYNSPLLIRETIDEVQSLADTGQLLIHERCQRLLRDIEQWRWDLPAGVLLEHVNRETIRPRMDESSHCEDALRYLVGVALRAYRAPKTEPEASGPVPPWEQGKDPLDPDFSLYLG